MPVSSVIVAAAHPGNVTRARRGDHMDDAAPQLNELGFYTLAGHSATPRDLIGEVRHAEHIGLGAAFVSERFNT